MSITLLSSDVADALIEAAELALTFIEDQAAAGLDVSYERKQLEAALNRAKEQAGGAS